MIKPISRKINECFISDLDHAVDYDFDHSEVNDFYLFLFNIHIYMLDAHRKNNDQSN